MKIRSLYLALLVSLVLPVGCHEAPVDANAPYRAAINAYWRVHPRCLWTQAVKMPTEEIATSGRSSGYNALTDMGFLQRTQADKKTFIFGAKAMSDYDLTDKGRAAWVQVPHSAGFGNFCFGHRSVTTIDNVSLTPATGSAPAMATVKYHFNLPDTADWIGNPELMAAFPGVAAVLAAQTDTATLMKTSSGWVMNTPQVAAPVAVSSDMGAQGPSPDSLQKDSSAAGQTPQPATAAASAPATTPGATTPAANTATDSDDTAETTPTHHHHHHHHHH